MCVRLDRGMSGRSFSRGCQALHRVKTSLCSRSARTSTAFVQLMSSLSPVGNPRRVVQCGHVAQPGRRTLNLGWVDNVAMMGA